MAEVNKKSGFSIFLKKVLRVLMRIWKRIVRFFKKSYNSFMNLKSYIRYIIYVWTIILIFIIVFIVLSNKNNQFIKEYNTYEDNFKNVSLEYIKEKNVFPSKAQPMKLSLDMLRADRYITTKEIADTSCVGYSLIYYDDVHEDYNIKPYINCDKYTTEGYEK